VFVRRPLGFMLLALPGTLVSALGVVGRYGPDNNAAGAITVLSFVVGILSVVATVSAADDLRATGSIRLGSVRRRTVARARVAILSGIVQGIAIFAVVIVGSIVFVFLPTTTESGPLALVVL